MSAPFKDPAGLLDRAPELVPLVVADGSLRAAVARGNPHAVYRKLWWARLLGRLKEHRPAIDTLLGQRRLFIAPVRRSPVLTTLNGVGASVYGREDVDLDGTYLKTHFLVFVFVPVFPLTQYLVRDAQKGWYFLGKVPMSAPFHFWNRLVVAGLLGALGVGAWSAAYASRHHDVHVVNALPAPVRVAIGDATLDVPANGRRVLSARTGRLPVRVSDTAGHVLESGEMMLAAGTDLDVWNVLGGAPIFERAVFYGDDKTHRPADAEPHFFCGERAIRHAAVDFTFAPPPHSIRLPEGQRSALRRQVDIAGPGIESCVVLMMRGGKAQPALALARGLIALDDSKPRHVQWAAALLRGTSGDEGLALLKASLARHPDSVEHHRSYQSLAQDQGKIQALREEYRARQAAAPDSPDAAYLYARVLPNAEAFALASAFSQRFPDHVPLHRIIIFQSVRDLRFETALASIERLRRLDPAEALVFLDEHVAALAALGRVEEAKKILQEAFQKKEGSREHLARLHAWLGGSPSAAPDPLLAKLGMDASDVLKFRAAAWMAPAGLSLAPLATDPDRPVIELVLHARSNPSAALQEVMRVSPASLGSLQPEVVVLLLGESIRSGTDAVRGRLEAAARNEGLPVPAIRAYLEQGTWSLPLDELSLSLQGALRLVRSRNVGLPPGERQSLRAWAVRSDPIGGYVRKAADDWPQT